MVNRLKLILPILLVASSLAVGQEEQSQEVPPATQPAASTPAETEKAPAPKPAPVVSEPAKRKVSLGRVAQAKSATKIYERPSTRARALYTVAPTETLVVQDYKAGSPWKKVLMSNFRYGYARASTIDVMSYDYLVDADSVPKPEAVATTRARSTLTSRSGGRTLGNADVRARLAKYSENFAGTPYVWGGNDLMNGIDCSGFVKQLYGKIGVSLPRTAAQQVNVGRPITRLEDLRAGDRLYFWDYKRNLVGHTGIYSGGGYFVHSSSTHKGVAKDYLGNPKWMRLLVAARR